MSIFSFYTFPHEQKCLEYVSHFYFWTQETSMSHFKVNGFQEVELMINMEFFLLSLIYLRNMTKVIIIAFLASFMNYRIMRFYFGSPESIKCDYVGFFRREGSLYAS